MPAKTFDTVLRKHGLVQMPWEQCPQGAKDSGDTYYNHPVLSIYAEVLRYGFAPNWWYECWIVGEGIPDTSKHSPGKRFVEPIDLENFLKTK